MKYVSLITNEWRGSSWNIEKDIFLLCMCRVEGKEEGWDSNMSTTTASSRKNIVLWVGAIVLVLWNEGLQLSVQYCTDV